MASLHPKCASGSQKRKAKAEKDKRRAEAMKGVPLISSIFSRPCAADTETQPSPSIPDAATESVPVAVPSPHPVTPIASPVKEVSNEPCTSISVDYSDIGVELVSSTDLGQWPLVMDEASRSHWISKG